MQAVKIFHQQVFSPGLNMRSNYCHIGYISLLANLRRSVDSPLICTIPFTITNENGGFWSSNEMLTRGSRMMLWPLGILGV